MALTKKMQEYKADAERFRWLVDHCEARHWADYGHAHPDAVRALIDSERALEVGTLGIPLDRQGMIDSYKNASAILYPDAAQADRAKEGEATLSKTETVAAMAEDPQP